MFKSVITLALVASAAAFAPIAPTATRMQTSLNSKAEQVSSLIAESLDVDISSVEPSTTFVGDLGLDSLDTVELIMAIEEEFDCEIPEEEAAKISTVGEVIDFIDSL
eukprot:jgi/Psemu1/308375/fgenesh1_kg.405_\